jgi:hypothetical protein
LLVWQSVVWWLALAGAFQGRIGPAPLLPIAIVPPLLFGLPILLNSNTIGQMLDATPPSWLVGLQVYRVFGSAFLIGWLAGNLPAISAVPPELEIRSSVCWRCRSPCYWHHQRVARAAWRLPGTCSASWTSWMPSR